MKLKTLILCTAMTGAMLIPAIAKAEEAATPAPAAAATEAAKPAEAPAEKAADKMEHKGPGNKMFEESDTNKDGKLSKEEFLARHEKKFAEIDANKDGSLTPDEMKSYGDSMREKFHDRMGKKDEKAPEAPAAK